MLITVSRLNGLTYRLPYRRVAGAREHLRTDRGRHGLRTLHRSGLSPYTRCRSPGALTLQPAGLLGRAKRPLSRDFDPSNCSSRRPLVNYQINLGRSFLYWQYAPSGRIERFDVSWGDQPDSMSQPRNLRHTVMAAGTRPHSNREGRLRGKEPKHPIAANLFLNGTVPTHPEHILRKIKPNCVKSNIDASVQVMINDTTHHDVSAIRPMPGDMRIGHVRLNQ